MTIEYIHLGNNNSISLILKEDGVAVSLDNVTRVTIKLDSVYDSDSLGFGAGQAFDVTTIDSESGSDQLVISLGGESITVANYPSAELVIYDAAHPNGLVWGDFLVRVQ